MKGEPVHSPEPMICNLGSMNLSNFLKNFVHETLIAVIECLSFIDCVCRALLLNERFVLNSKN